MKDIDIRKIEDSLNIKLPKSYKKIMTSHPSLELLSKYIESMDDPDELVEENEQARLHGFWGMKWIKNHFLFGGAGNGDWYFIDVNKAVSPVFVADHETSSRTEKDAETLEEWVEMLLGEIKTWEEKK